MEPLLPDRYPNRDFFVADILDAMPKDDMASMEHPEAGYDADIAPMQYSLTPNRHS